MKKPLEEWAAQAEAWTDAYLEGANDHHEEILTSIPPVLRPLFRRFFWWPLEAITEDYHRKVFWGGSDEDCNKTIGIRCWGGVLFIRRGWRVRQGTGFCDECKKEFDA